MWLWQRNNIHKRHLLWAKLFCLCLFAHLIFLFWIFCAHHDASYAITIALNTKIDYSAPVLFVPLGTQTTMVQKKITPAKPVVQKTAAKKNTTIIETIQPPIKKVPVKKTPVEKTIIAEPVKKLVDAPKPLAVPEKSREKNINMPKPIPMQPVPAPTIAKKPVQIIPEHARISSNYREVEAMRRAAQLQKELVKNWHAPVGISKDCMCEISVTVSKQGTIKHFAITKSSGVLFYNMSARQALFSMTMPQWTYGKTFTINFKQ